MAISRWLPLSAPLRHCGSYWFYESLSSKKEMTRHPGKGMDPDMKALLTLPLIVASLLLTGCNTFKGVGEDITGAASWSQEKMTGSGGSSTKSSDSDYVSNPPQFPKSN